MRPPASKPPLDDPVYSVTWYMQGYFPLYDMFDRFYWERLPERAVLPINAETVVRAKAMARRAERRFGIVRNQHFDACIRHLQDPGIKEYSWVRAEVVQLYHALRKANLLFTLEAINSRKQLAGGLIGILLPGICIAETMFTLEPDASKLCLCRLIADLHAAGFSLMDVQTRHDRDPWGEPIPPSRGSPHPCVRLGEEVWRIGRFMNAFHRILQDSGVESPEGWVKAAGEKSDWAMRWLRPGLGL